MWLRALHNLRSWTSRKPHLLRFGATTVLGAVLLTPSIWMLSVIPPLWRNVDAYFQVTQPPVPGNASTMGAALLFRRANSALLRIRHRLCKGGRFISNAGFFYSSHPDLNLGVFLILLSQRLALCSAAFYLIALASRFFWVRLTLP